MAVLAIDIVTLYVASGQAQKTADAAALAGAKVFVSSGFTSGQLGLPSSAAAQTLVCNGSTGLSDLQAQATAARNFLHMLASFATFQMPGRELTLDNPDAVKVPFGVAVAFAMILYTVSRIWVRA